MTATSPKRNDKKTIIQNENRIATLKKLLLYYKDITETIREPFIILDKNLYVVTANPAFYRKFKVIKKDTEGRRMYELGNNQWDGKELRELLEHILPKHRVLNNYEITLDFPVLGQKTMLLNARQVDSKQLILLAVEDITAQRMLKANSEEVTANLIQQRDRLQKLNDAKDEFISLASHQLRTPATVVKQYMGMLTQGFAGEMPIEQMAMVNVVYRNNERQLEIIEDLLRVAKVDAGKVYLEKSPCDVGLQIESVILEQSILFVDRGQRVVFKVPKQPIIASIDSKLMRMVFENLLDNAGKYSPAATDVIVTVKQNDAYTEISLKDSGLGIRKIDQQKLFKKFSRINNSMSATVQGTGLGLYWAKKILDLHGGDIGVISRPNKGSTFTVKIPIFAEKVSEIPAIAQRVM